MAKVKKSPKELEALWLERANAAREDARKAMNRRVRSISHKIARLESDEVFNFWEELSEKNLSNPPFPEGIHLNTLSDFLGPAQ